MLLPATALLVLHITRHQHTAGYSPRYLPPTAVPTLLVQYTGAYAPRAQALSCRKAAQTGSWARLLHCSMDDQ
jgi:hypothetical protein